MSAAQYKITYFDIRGLAELPRLVLAATGAQWEDDRIPFNKKEDGSFDRGDWDNVRKPQQPYEQVPVLTVNGNTKIAQSAAIVRFLARRHGLEGKDDIETAQIDAAFEAVVDFRKAWRDAKSNPDASKLAEYFSKTFPEAMRLLNKNASGAPFFGSKLSYVDIAIYYSLFVIATENKEAVEKALADNKNIKSINDAVAKDERIAKYVAARKQTMF